jgi:hypothetical protein
MNTPQFYTVKTMGIQVLTDESLCEKPKMEEVAYKLDWKKMDYL